MFDESTKLCDVRYKIVFLGQSAVGKSAVIERFIQERFDSAKAVRHALCRKRWESTFS
jgi:GTPase SAR1 family protein